MTSFTSDGFSIEHALLPSLEEVENSFREFVAREEFPCLGARATLRQDACTLRVYGSLGDDGQLSELARDLALFGASIEDDDRRFNSFVAVFPADPPLSEIEFDARLWRHLELLRQVDTSAPGTHTGKSSDPDDPEFAFGFGGVAYFIVGLSPVSSRLGRQFSWPALVFNPHAVFDRLRHEGNYDRMKALIRNRDMELQGTLNPNLADFGVISEARQYSGLEHSPDWKCPFHTEKK